MCWPTCRGGAYIAVSSFIYRSILLILSMISCSITQLKWTYLPISLMEELLLLLIYFIPLFISSSFVLVGIETNSFNYTFYSAIFLAITLFLRYSLEIAYICLYGWNQYFLKLPDLSMNVGLDLIFLLVILLYSRNRLRNKREARKYFEQEGLHPENFHHNHKHPNNLPRKASEPNFEIIKMEDGRSVFLGPTGLPVHYPIGYHEDAAEKAKDKTLPPTPKEKDELDEISLPEAPLIKRGKYEPEH